MDKHRSLFYRKFSDAAGTHFDIRSIKYQRGEWGMMGGCFHGLTLEPGGAVRPRNAYTALSSLASKKAS